MYQDGNIPLFTAINGGNLGLCRELLLDMSIEQTNYHLPATGETSLHMAVAKRDMELLKMLVEFGGDVNEQDVSISQVTR